MSATQNTGLVVRLDPTLAQRRLFSGCAGARRFAHNWAVAKVKENAELWQSQRDAGIEAKVRVKPLSLIELGTLWRAERGDVAPWYGGYPSELYNFAFRDVVAAHRNFLAGRARFPRFKKRSQTPAAFTVCFTARLRAGSVVLSRIGEVAISAPDTHQAKTRRLIRRDRARITSVRVYARHNHWWASLAIEREVTSSQRPTTPTGSVVGVDLGLKSQAVVATSGSHAEHVVTGGRRFEAALATTRRLSRAVSRKVRGSANAREAARRLRAHQGRISNRRKDDLHVLTKNLSTTFPAICVEDLCVRGISRSPRLGRATLDQALGELRRQLSYKTERNGSRLIVADRFYPSSKTCARCGAVKAKLPLGVRTYRCEHCGAVADRDVNAAANLALWGEAVLVTEAMAIFCGHGVQSGDPDRPGPSVTRPRVKGSKVNASHARGEGSAGPPDRPVGETVLVEAGSSRQLVCT